MKTYRAIRHDVVRAQQRDNAAALHHPQQKEQQIREILKGDNLSVLELFAGFGNCTKVFADYGRVIALERSLRVFEALVCDMLFFDRVECRRVDSFREVHRFLLEGKRFDVVDLDPYGFPNRFFPDIFLLIDDGVLFVTMPKPNINILNGITQAHLISYYGEHNPSKEVIIERIALWGICHWRRVELLNVQDCKSVWRFAFGVKKVKATDYTGVRNR